MSDNSEPDYKHPSVFNEMMEHYRHLSIKIPEGWLFALLDEYTTEIGLEKNPVKR